MRRAQEQLQTKYEINLRQKVSVKEKQAMDVL